MRTLPTRNEIMAERRRLRRKYKGLYEELSGVLYRHDPIHIGHTRDEYEPEVGRILARGEASRSVAELTDVIHSVFVEMFDQRIAGPRSRYQQIARDVWDLIHRSATT